MIYNVLRLRTTGVAASLVKKYKPRPGCKADGVTVWRAIKETYEPCDFVQKQALHTRPLGSPWEDLVRVQTLWTPCGEAVQG